MLEDSERLMKQRLGGLTEGGTETREDGGCWQKLEEQTESRD